MLRNLESQENLDISNETKLLINRYRILKALEHASRKYANDVDNIIIEEMGGNIGEMKNLFISLAFISLADNSIKSQDYLKSLELATQSALFRILKDKGELEEAVAELFYREYKGIGMEDVVNNSIVNKYASHIRYYLNHPEIKKDYKLA